MTKRNGDEGIIVAPLNRLLIPKECQPHSMRLCSLALPCIMNGTHMAGCFVKAELE